MSDAGLTIALSARDAGDVERLLRTVLPEVPEGGQVFINRSLPDGGPLDRCVVIDLDGPAFWNELTRRSGRSDVLLVGGWTELSPGAVEAIAAVASGNPELASVTALGSSAGYLSVPHRNVPGALPSSGRTVAQTAELVRSAALGLHPRIPTALPHFALVKRAAIELVGEFDEAMPERDALADFCARATAAGMRHLAADELFVGVREEGEVVTGWDGPAAATHPSFDWAIDEAATDRGSSLARALLAVSVALEPLTVTVDARGLKGASGTVTHTIGLLSALGRSGDVRVRAVTSSAVPSDVEKQMAGLDGVELLGEHSIDKAGRTHVAHRPFQVESVQDLELLDRLGERTVITHQDLIGYRTPSVFASPQQWRDYREVTRAALGTAAAVLFFTGHAAQDALADDLVTPDRAHVVGLGVDLHGPTSAGRRPGSLADDGRPFLLVLGARFRHKNVRFALQLVDALIEEHGWDGHLVVAGREVLHGSGSNDDAAWLLANPSMEAAFTDLGAVDDDERDWLMQNAAAVIAPSTYEGFGLVPFEAAAHGTPCLVAPVSSVAETMPAGSALLTPWDARASAAESIGVLTPGAARDALVASVRAAAEQMGWASVVPKVITAYKSALTLPQPSAARMTAQLADVERRYWSVRDGLTDSQLELFRSDAPLVDDQGLALLHAALERPGPDRVRRTVRAWRVARWLNRR